MAIPETIDDIMVRNVITCHPGDTLGQVRRMMKEHGIRHIPVVNPDSREFVGLVTQKSVLRSTFLLINRFGVEDLEHQENKKSVAGIMEKAVDTVTPGMSLREAGEFFTRCKNGCLPVLEGGQLVGIVTSSDFVKLSLALLDAFAKA